MCSCACWNRLSELLDLMRMRKSRQGIDVHKLSSGDAKKKRRRRAESPEDKGGLRAGAGAGAATGAGASTGGGGGGGGGAKTEPECVRVRPRCRRDGVADRCASEQPDAEAKARRAVRTNNFTQQTNTLDVDKHMCVVGFPLRGRGGGSHRVHDDAGWLTLKTTSRSDVSNRTHSKGPRAIPATTLRSRSGGRRSERQPTRGA